MSSPPERHHAQEAVRQLFFADRDALAGMLSGEGIRDLANRRSISVIEAADIRDRLKRKLGVRTDAEAVRIGLLADQT